jgi:hypothetical protein
MVIVLSSSLIVCVSSLKWAVEIGELRSDGVSFGESVVVNRGAGVIVIVGGMRVDMRGSAVMTVEEEVAESTMSFTRAVTVSVATVEEEETSTSIGVERGAGAGAS